MSSARGFHRTASITITLVNKEQPVSPTISPVDILPNRERCALLVIDIQERLTVAMPADVLSGVLRSTCTLIQTAHEFSLPVLISEQYPKGLGPTVADIRAISANSQPLEKVEFSCCRAPAVAPALEALKGYDFILCGMETHVCVLQTAIDLLQRGHRVYAAADGMCSRTAFNHNTGLALMRDAGAVIGSAEVFAFGLLGAAGTERFKRISKLVK